MMKNFSKSIAFTCTALLLVLVCSACAAVNTPSPRPTAAPSPTALIPGLSPAQAAALDSLQQVDDYPLYTMHYYLDEGENSQWSPNPVADIPSRPDWGCSLFAALGGTGSEMFGRNFDWQYSPALLLFTHPADGYDSVTMVDIAYLGFDGEDAQAITELPLRRRKSLLQSPWWTFDGMNDQGLAVGMAAVPPGGMPVDPDKETLDSLNVMREILDNAASVPEAVAILGQYNIDYGGGPPLHYMVADASGDAVLVEFWNGEMHILENQEQWHLATNFLVSSVPASPEELCWRYAHILRKMEDQEGALTETQAMDLLDDVSQDGTQWSLVYELDTLAVHVVMGGEYQTVHTFMLEEGE